MALSSQNRVHNLLLRAAPSEAFALLDSHMERIELTSRLTLVEPDSPTQFVCFIESGLASVVVMTPNSQMTEVGHIGFEGATGLHTTLHSEQTPSRTFVQGEGFGYRVPVSVIREITEQVPMFGSLLLRYVQASNIQLSYTAVANARFSIYERLARWLLMCQDRLGDDIGLTHEFLAVMLGVRRSGVTDHLHLLEGINAIKATRGNIRILDRAKLEEIAGACYGVAEREYERLVGFSPRLLQPID